MQRLALLVWLCSSALVQCAIQEHKLAAPVWPQQFHAVLFQNRSNILATVDLFYDYPNGRNLNIVRPQLGKGGVLWDLDWNNKTSAFFNRDAHTCRLVAGDAGLLPPNWLRDATNLGVAVVDGIVCSAWVRDYLRYYEDQETRRPVMWMFTDSGAVYHIMEFTAGSTMGTTGWQAPGYCFRPHAAADPDALRQEPAAGSGDAARTAREQVLLQGSPLRELQRRLHTMQPAQQQQQQHDRGEQQQEKEQQEQQEQRQPIASRRLLLA